LTALLKPFRLVTVTVDTPGDPVVVVTDAGFDAMLKSGEAVTV